ncbi:enolase C-terminal domain-like protein [Nonomuraea dietziae]|uniref:enolase C-terminal domain-like protein n=1 Tax=Nonomuraea dietziae TaxID=65515 RepID=UPI0031E12C7F
MRTAAKALIGARRPRRRTRSTPASRPLVGDVVSDLHGLTGVGHQGRRASTGSTPPFEVACLDIRWQGARPSRQRPARAAARCGGTVPYSAYLFYKWAGHPGEADDRFGAALDPEGIVAQARLLIEEYGFRSIKLKGGVFEPSQEVDAILALREAFPSHPLRLDPNAVWSVETSLEVARALEGTLEYLEDPTAGIEDMAAVAARAPMPLATNMCVVTFEHLPPAIRQGAIGVLLSDHHYWGGLERSVQLARLCETFGISLSMHSNSHLGISLAAMTHLAAAVPNVATACDTHTPWQDGQDVVAPGALRFVDGAVPVPKGPGLGVELDRDALAVMHEQYLTCGFTARDDTSYMRRFNPSFTNTRPRW